MSSFGSVSFRVKVDSDGFWPAPSRQSDGSVSYKADIVLSGASAQVNMQDAVTRGTVKPVAGLSICNYHVEAGIGPRPLVVPGYRGVLRTYPVAILTSFDSLGSGEFSGDPMFWASAEWILISDITP